MFNSSQETIHKHGWLIIPILFWLSFPFVFFLLTYNIFYHCITLWRTCISQTNESSRLSAGFRGISQLGYAFIFLRCFKLAHICIQVTSLHNWNKQEINRKFLIGNRFHATLRIVSPYILYRYNQIESKLAPKTRFECQWRRFRNFSAVFVARVATRVWMCYFVCYFYWHDFRCKTSPREM